MLHEHVLVLEVIVFWNSNKGIRCKVYVQGSRTGVGVLVWRATGYVLIVQLDYIKTVRLAYTCRDHRRYNGYNLSISTYWFCLL